MKRQRRIAMSETGYIVATALSSARAAETIARDIQLPEDAPDRIVVARRSAAIALGEIRDYLQGRIACR
jgi:hypothetical protein